MRPRTLHAAAVALAALAAGCSGGGGAVPDAAPDARPVDAGPDAENLCPGALTYQGHAKDLLTDTNLPDIAVVVEGSPDISGASAPNGRITLCLPAGVTSRLVGSRLDYLDRVEDIDPDAASLATAAERSLPFDVVTTADLDTLLLGLAVPRDPDAATVLVAANRFPSGEPLAGATVDLTAVTDGAFARDGAGDFVAGTATLAGGLILFANVPVGAGSAAVTLSPPGGETCHGPSSVPLRAGAIAAASFACE